MTRAPKELVVISGKGGTGKTSIAASLAMLAGDAVIADCDVEAADLHILLAPRIRERHRFLSGHEAAIRAAACTRCGACVERCRFGAIQMDGVSGDGTPFVDPLLCEGCGVCARVCPVSAIDFRERVCGEWMVSSSRCGPMVHARLAVAAGNSGKLVSQVRREARRIAEEQGHPLVIIDGPPGIGCPVIASITGASYVLVVSEPTVAGVHDLDRVMALIGHFGVPSGVCINKWDLNPEMAGRIESAASQGGGQVIGRIRYDDAVTRAQLQRRTVVEIGGVAAEDVRSVWLRLRMMGAADGRRCA